MEWWQILVSILGAIAGLSTLIIFFVNRHDSKKFFTEDEKNEILVAVRKIPTIELDTMRLQILNLIQHSPNNHDTILNLARQYFKKLHGNSYMIAIVCEWGKQEGIDAKVIEELINNEHIRYVVE